MNQQREYPKCGLCRRHGHNRRTCHRYQVLEPFVSPLNKPIDAIEIQDDTHDLIKNLRNQLTEEIMILKSDIIELKHQNEKYKKSFNILYNRFKNMEKNKVYMEEDITSLYNSVRDISHEVNELKRVTRSGCVYNALECC